MNPVAEGLASEVMAMNRQQRRAFKKKNKLPFTIYGSQKPLIKAHGNIKTKETS